MGLSLVLSIHYEFRSIFESVLFCYRSSYFIMAHNLRANKLICKIKRKRLALNYVWRCNIVYDNLWKKNQSSIQSSICRKTKNLMWKILCVLFTSADCHKSPTSLELKYRRHTIETDITSTKSLGSVLWSSRDLPTDWVPVWKWTINDFELHKSEEKISNWDKK